MHRQVDGGLAPPGSGAERGARIATWQAESAGLDWLDALVAREDALVLAVAVASRRYAARARHLLDTILAGPPKARRIWSSPASDILTAKWLGRTGIDRPLAHSCSPEEWLLIDAVAER